MKKLVSVILAMIVVSGMLFITSCGENDVTKPVITITGDNPDVVVYKSAATYTDPGATAEDDKDGEVVVTAQGTVNMNSAGEYTIDYSASDKEGNTATAVRTVIVDAAEYLAGSYTVSDYTYNGGGETYNGDYPETISTSIIEENRINFIKFAFYNNGAAYATIAGSTITVPQQNITCGTAPDVALRTFSGTGTFTATTMTINYTEVTNSTTSTGRGDYVRN